MCNNKKINLKINNKKLNDKRDTLFSIVNQNRKVCSFGNCICSGPICMAMEAYAFYSTLYSNFSCAFLPK